MDKKKLSYLRELRNELKKISWTSKTEIIFSTKVVIIATFVFGFAIYGVDFMIRGAMNMLGAIMQSILG